MVKNRVHFFFRRHTFFPIVSVSAVVLLLLSCSGEQRGTSDVEVVPDTASTVMLKGGWVPDDTRQIDFERLPRIPSEHGTVSDVRDQGGKRVNQHNYLVYFNNRFWAMWSDGPGEPRTTPDKHRDVFPGHDRADQIVSFATSKDGLTWSAKADLAGTPEPGYGWIARGFWVRDGKLLALASRYKAPSYAGEGLQLHAFELATDEPIAWRHLGLVYDDAMNNFPPKKIPTGEWMMSRRDQHRDVHFMVGGEKAFDDWESFPVVSYSQETLAAEEPYWWVLPDGKNILALFRDNDGSGSLHRAYSMDNGRTWSHPVATNFPDAKSKFSGVRLRDGRYLLVSNPNPKQRDPLALSISNDGIHFHFMGYLVGGRKVDYPHIIEHEGYVYIAFASAKQTVEVLRVALDDLKTLKN